MYKKALFIAIMLMSCWCKTDAQTDAQKEDLKQTSTKINSLLQIWNNVDSSKVSRLDAASSLVNQYLYNDRDSAIKYLNLIEEFSNKHKLDNGIARSNYFKGILFNLAGQLDSSMHYYNNAYDGYSSLSNTLQMSRTIINIAIIDFEKGRFQGAIDKLNDNIEMCVREFGESHWELGLSYGLLGDIYSQQGYNQLALSNSLIALRFHEENGDNIRKADMLNQLGNIEFNLGNYEKVVQYNLEAIAIYQEYKDYYYQSQANADIGNAYIELNQYQNAEPYLTKGLELAKQMDAKSLEGKIYAYQSKKALAERKSSRALQLLDQSFRIHKDVGNPSEMAAALEKKGRVYLNINQPKEALNSFNQVIAMADTIDIVDQLHSSLYYRALAYEGLNQSTLALQDLKMYQELHDSLLNKTTIEQIEELRILHNIERSEKEILLQKKEISLLEKEATVSRLQKWLLGGGLGLTLAMFGLGFYGIRQKMKRNQLQHQNTLKEKELETEKRRNAESELEFKKKELTAKALQLAKKNEFLLELEVEVTELQSSVDTSVGKASSRISRMIQRDTVDDEEWEQFSSEFTSVHQGFLDRLRERYGTFSKGEMRLIYLLRMNMSSKEIASLLHISGEGIRKARYRLRKKMGLDPSEDLQGLILGM